MLWNVLLKKQIKRCWHFSDKTTINNSYLHIVNQDSIYKQDIPKLLDNQDFTNHEVYNTIVDAKLNEELVNSSTQATNEDAQYGLI